MFPITRLVNQPIRFPHIYTEASVVVVVVIAAFAESSWSLIWARMKDGYVEDMRNLLPVDDAANECVPREQSGWTMQFSNFHPATLSALSNCASSSFDLYGLPTSPLSRPLSSATRTIIKHVDSRPVVNLALFYPYSTRRFKGIL